MGYSCTQMAAFAQDSMLRQLKAQNDVPASNGWQAKGKEYFVDRGDEQQDGAITAPVFEIRGEFSHRAGGVRIEPDGKVTRWPSSTAKQRQQAEADAKVEYRRRHGVEFPEVAPLVAFFAAS